MPRQLSQVGDVVTVIIYSMVLFALAFAAGLLWLYWKKRYWGLLLVIGLLVVWSGYAVYLVNQEPPGPPGSGSPARNGAM